MIAEGSANKEISAEEVQYKVSERGYIATNVEICFDDMQGFWKFIADIKPKNSN
jgi:hypothetical protein